MEHVFNYPTAIKNCLEFVRPGGHFIAISPCNNYLGHGFYQFSPELYFRILIPENGFEIQRVLLVEAEKDAQWWAVRDPAVIRCRATLINDRPTMMYVLAKKIASVIPFQPRPSKATMFPCGSPLQKLKRSCRRQSLRGAFRHPCGSPPRISFLQLCGVCCLPRSNQSFLRRLICRANCEMSAEKVNIN